MIVSFADKQAEALFNRRRVKRLDPKLQQAAIRSLRLLHRAQTLDDLKSPPGNRLELLKGDWRGWHSIRINNQWRICFCWRSGNAYDVKKLWIIIRRCGNDLKI